MELFRIRCCSAGNQKFADTRGDLGRGVGLGKGAKSQILGLFYVFFKVVLANVHFSSCKGFGQILELFSV